MAVVIFLLIFSVSSGWLPRSISFVFLKINGFPIAPLANRTPSTPVVFSISTAFLAVNMFPEPITGISKLVLSFFRDSQSASPLYPWLRVLACMVSRLAPPFTAASAKIR